MNKNRREQKSKGMGNKAMSNAMQGKRFSNAAGPHKSANDYQRRPKHRNRGWGE